MFFRKTKRIIELEHDMEIVKHDLDQARVEKDRLNERLRRLSTEEHEYFNSSKVKTIAVELEPLMYGQYVKLDRDQITDQIIEQAEKKLAESLAMAMIKHNLVKFIVHTDPDDCDPLNMFATVGAKLTVVPWEQMTKKKIVFRQKVDDGQQ